TRFSVVWCNSHHLSGNRKKFQEQSAWADLRIFPVATVSIYPFDLSVLALCCSILIPALYSFSCGYDPLVAAPLLCVHQCNPWLKQSVCSVCFRQFPSLIGVDWCPFVV